ncbi:carbohydrate porin [Komagataeibacter rhaeticus]|nr:carbohydrate porin [Komagataeibacter rhaeticus]
MVYGIIDQMIWRPSIRSARSVGIFARATGNSGDRNMISFAVDAGINLKAPSGAVTTTRSVWAGASGAPVPGSASLTATAGPMCRAMKIILN